MAPNSSAPRTSRPAVIRRRAPRLLYLWLALAICACNESTAPRAAPGEPGLRILAGGVTDTAAAMLPQAIVAEVGDARGYPMGGAVVHFDALPVDSAHPFSFTAYVRRIQDQFIRRSVVDTTHGTRRARVQVALGRLAGPVSVVVHLHAQPLPFSRSLLQPALKP